MYLYPFRMTSTTATLMLIDPVAEDIIIGVRSDGAWVYPGADSLPGGFMEARFTEEQGAAMAEIRALVIEKMNWKAVADEYHEGEDAHDCAIREAFEELSITLARHQLRLFDVRANARTDTRAHVTNVCFYAELTPAQVLALEAGDDLQEIKRLPIADLRLEMPYEALAAKYPMAFNHFELMMGGLMKWDEEKRALQTQGELVAARLEIARLQERITNMGWDLSNALGHSQGGA